MKFSILLPTRDRLELLRLAVESVRRQDVTDWEIIVSDNVSAQDVRGYVSGLGDSRVRYVRTSGPVSVTENWNNALRAATGEFVIMLGDDDGLFAGCLRALEAAMHTHCEPDVVYMDAIQYAYPEVFPDHPGPFTRQGYAEFLRPPAPREPFWLPPERARKLVEHTMAFRIAFGFNMQHYAVSRRMIERLTRDGGEFFRSPYPDYYAANALMLESDRILVVPDPLVAIGISPRSFGYFFANQREETGDVFLNNAPDPALRERLRSIVLPGTTLLSSWLYALEVLREGVPRARTMPIDYDRYRMLQVYMTFKRAGLRGVRDMLPRLRPSEIARGAALGGLLGAVRLVPSRLAEPATAWLRDRVALTPHFDSKVRDVSYRDILELIAAESRVPPWRDT